MGLSSLSGPVRGALWMICTALSLTAMAVMVRFLTPQVPVLEQIFIRNVVTLFLLAPMLLRTGLASFRTERLGGHALRNALLYAGNVAWFFGVTMVSLAEVSALQFTMPLFTLILAAIFLKEVVGRHRWLATAVGFAGALIIIRPGVVEVGAGSLLVVIAALFFSCTHVVTKRLSDTESGAVVVFYMSVSIVVFSLVPALYVWVTPAWPDAPALIALGVTGYTTHYCVTRAMATADASYVAPFDFLRLPFSAALGFFLFAEPLDPWTWAGATVIFAAAYYNTWRETREPAAPWA